MRPSTVRAKLNNNEPVLIYCLHLTDPSVWEMLSLIGVDAIWLDMEHHGHNMETAGHLCRAARVGSSDVMARPAKGEYMRMGRMLELGAHGVLYPRCTSAAEAREVVRWSKFAPLGERGADGANPDQPYCSMDLKTYTEFANRETFVFIQIEDEAGLREVDEIASIEGVDGIMLGPGDFSVLGGFPGDLENPRIHEALDRIGRAATREGKAWGTTTTSPRNFQRLFDAGARLIFSGADIVALKNEFTALKALWGPMGVTFNDELNMESGGSYLEKR